MLTRYQNVNDDNESIEVGVNLEFEKESYETFAQNVLWIFLKIREGSADELTLLLELLEELNSSLKEKLEATLAGYRVVDGWFEIYFYAYSAKKFENITASVVGSKYSYEVGSYKDTKYKLYFDELYPDEMQFLQIRNSDIISSLHAAGDNHEAIREVEHYLFFPTKSNAQRAISKAQSLEFTCKEELVDDESELRHAIVLTQVHSVTPEVVDTITKELMQLAMDEHGLYEGWSTTLA
ncbi:MAG: DUF695 domain-containing protein [Campylobacterota bacterium]|nr:DUF695 domain-containing protein [Campylobacterota bacterium]